MSLQIYVYDTADLDEPELVEELDDIEDAVARCHDLVENDGHARAEAWDEEGDCRYGVALRAGVVRTYGAPRYLPPDAPVERSVERRVERADLPPPPSEPPSPPRAPRDLLRGEEQLPPERWFGI